MLELTSMTTKGILLQNAGDGKLVVFDISKKQWVNATSEDRYDFGEAMSTITRKLLPIDDKLNAQVGFMANFKKDYMVFKIRDISQKRNTGARCDQSSKLKSVQLLNSLSEHHYELDINLSRQELCVMQEFYLRKLEMESMDGKKWFLTPTEAVIINKKMKMI